MTNEPVELQLVGFVSLSPATAGFGLPLFGCQSDAKALFVQNVDEITGRVSGFVKLEGDIKAANVVRRDMSVRAGEYPIYAFNDRRALFT